MTTHTENIHPHFDLIQAHADCQAGMYLSGVYRDSEWFGGFSAVVSDFFWNFASPIVLPDNKDGESSIYDFFGDIDRIPALYGENEFIDETSEVLSIKDTEVGYEDVWMAYSHDDIEVGESTLEIKDIRRSGSVEDFIEVFKHSYGDTSADDPYAGLPPTYIEAIKNAFTTPYLADGDSHLVALDDGNPVAIGSSIRSGDKSFIYNMGTIPERQGEGIGSQIAKRLIDRELSSGADEIVLQTEPESYVQEFYSELGFEPRFEAKALIDGNWDDRFNSKET